MNQAAQALKPREVERVGKHGTAFVQVNPCHRWYTRRLKHCRGDFAAARAHCERWEVGGRKNGKPGERSPDTSCTQPTEPANVTGRCARSVRA
jgi:hypothetical protein